MWKKKKKKKNLANINYCREEIKAIENGLLYILYDDAAPFMGLLFDKC